MTVSTLTWRRSAAATLGAQTVAGFLAALKALVDAEVAANPSTYEWSVADYSAINGTLVLKPKSGATQRIMIFGGSSPHTNAIDGAAAATTTIYIGCADSAGVDAPQVAYTAGAPFTTGNWMAGGSWTNTTAMSTTLTQLEYWENADGIWFVNRRVSMNQSSNNGSTAYAGKLAVTVDGNTAYHIAQGSAANWTTSVDSLASPTSGVPISLGTEVTTSNTRANYYEADTTTVRRCSRMFCFRDTGINAKMRNNNARRYFLPMYMCNSSEDRVMIKLRQIAWGMYEAHGVTMSDASGIVGHKIGFRDDQVGDGPWLVNIVI